MTNAPLSECVCIVNVARKIPQMYTYCLPEEAENAKKQAEESDREWAVQCRKNAERYPENAESQLRYAKEHEEACYEIMDFETFHKREREAILSGPLESITEEQFNDMLDVLPPLRWETHNGIEEFCMREMWTGTYTTQYAHVHGTDEYYSKMVDCADRSTWIHNILMKRKEESENAAASA